MAPGAVVVTRPRVPEPRRQPCPPSQPAGDRGDEKDKSDLKDCGSGRFHSATRSLATNVSFYVQRICRAGSRLGPTCASSQPVSCLLSLIACPTRSFASTVCSQEPGFPLRLPTPPLHRSSPPPG